jgi:hypothetical protein
VNRDKPNPRIGDGPGGRTERCFSLNHPGQKHFRRLGECGNTTLIPGAPAPAGLGVGLGFAQAGDAVAGFPLTAFFQDFDAFEPFENIALGAQSARTAETWVL